MFYKIRFKVFFHTDANVLIRQLYFWNVEKNSILPILVYSNSSMVCPFPACKELGEYNWYLEIISTDFPHLKPISD